MPPDITNSPQLPETPATPAPVTPQPPAAKGPNGMAMKLLIAVAVIFLAMIVVYALTQPKHKATSTKSTSQLQTAAVSITSTGFSPQTIEIKAGTQVTWTNNDTAVHQVAPDPYPKDDSIPDFRSGVVLQTKDALSFTFSNAGTYSYHDEQNPLKFTGTVIVK